MTTYMNQTQLAEQFGLSFEEMDEILIEHELKSGELATQKAMDDDYVRCSFMEDSRPFYHWNIIKISELTGIKLQDEIGFYLNDVMMCIQIADEQADPEFALLMATHAYDGVPEDLLDEVHKRVDREIIGDRRRACEKCGRMTFWRFKGFCWRCLPDDSFIQKRLDYEAAIREAAAHMATVGWGTLYADNNLEPKDSDIELWNGAVDNAIDNFLTYLIDPSKYSEPLAGDIIDDFTHGRPFAEFVYSGYDDHGWKRCGAFLELAYETVAGVLTKEAT
jgi:hypothetical protein